MLFIRRSYFPFVVCRNDISNEQATAAMLLFSACVRLRRLQVRSFACSLNVSIAMLLHTKSKTRFPIDEQKKKSVSANMSFGSACFLLFAVACAFDRKRAKKKEDDSRAKASRHFAPCAINTNRVSETRVDHGNLFSSFLFGNSACNSFHC